MVAFAGKATQRCWTHCVMAGDGGGESGDGAGMWRALVFVVVAISVVVVIGMELGLGALFSVGTPTPTPVPIVRVCVNRPRVMEEVLVRFSQEVPLLDPNDMEVIDNYSHRPSGPQYTDEERANMLVYSIVFRAQKPGTGKYLRGRYDVLFHNDVACKIRSTELDW